MFLILVSSSSLALMTNMCTRTDGDQVACGYKKEKACELFERNDKVGEPTLGYNRNPKP